jgi:hypothetical protein
MGPNDVPVSPQRSPSHLLGYGPNSVQIMQGDINSILRDEIPLFTVPFIDDVAIKGPVTHYENADGTYETIPENSGICRFVWEHTTSTEFCNGSNMSAVPSLGRNLNMHPNHRHPRAAVQL